MLYVLCMYVHLWKYNDVICLYICMFVYIYRRAKVLLMSGLTSIMRIISSSLIAASAIAAGRFPSYVKWNNKQSIHTQIQKVLIEKKNNKFSLWNSIAYLDDSFSSLAVKHCIKLLNAVPTIEIRTQQILNLYFQAENI